MSGTMTSSAKEYYTNQAVQQSNKSSVSVVPWEDLSSVQQDMFKSWWTNRGAAPNTQELAKCTKSLYLFHCISDLFSDPAWIAIQADGTLKSTGAFIINQYAVSCECPAFNLNSTCRHSEVLSFFVKEVQGSADTVLPEKSHSWAILAYHSNDFKVKLQYVDFVPFIQPSGTFSPPSRIQECLNKGDGSEWVPYFAMNARGSIARNNYDSKDAIRLGRAVNISLVLDSTPTTLQGRVTAKSVEEVIKNIAPKLRKPAQVVQDTDLPVIATKEAKITLRDWLKYKKPNESLFYIADDVWRQCLFMIAAGKNVMFTGPAGSGKTQLGKILGKQCQRRVEVFDFGAMTEPRLSLIGNTAYSPEKGTYFEYSRFARAITTEDTVIVLDELSRAGKEAANILFPVLDDRRELAIDERQEVLPVAKGVCFLATANVGTEYTGTSSIDRALRDRFSQIEIGFPPEDKEIKILTTRTGLPEKFAKHLVKIAASQRQMATQDMTFVEQISPRMLLMAAEQTMFGIPFHEAIKYAISGMFSSEGGTESDRFKVNQIVSTNVDKKDLAASLV